MTVTSNPVSDISIMQGEIVQTQQDAVKQPKHKKTQYYKGTLSSPFAMEMLGKMV